MKEVLAALLLALVASTAFGADVLVSVNWKRGRLGYQPYKHSVYLTRLAQAEAENQARNGYGHKLNMRALAQRLGGRVDGGVGSRPVRDFYGQKFKACNCIMSGGYAGAAAVVRGNTTYYSIVVSSVPVK